MNKGKTIFAQIMSLINEYEFKKCVDRYRGDRHTIKFNCRDQFLVMSFAQFTDRSGLRDIETTLDLCAQDLYRSGLKAMPRSTLAEANEKKDWRIYQDFAKQLMLRAKDLYQGEKLRVDLDEMIYAFDSTTIDLCLALCSWATFHLNHAFFVTRAKDNMRYEVIERREVVPQAGLISDETIRLTGYYSSRKYPDMLRLVMYEDFKEGTVYRFPTNNFSLEAITIAELYRDRWQIEIFFK